MPSKRKREGNENAGPAPKKLIFEGEEVKLRKDGKPDMRYSVSKRYVASLQLPGGGAREQGPQLRTRNGNVVQAAASIAVPAEALENVDNFLAPGQARNVRRARRVQPQPMLPLPATRNNIREADIQQQLQEMETVVLAPENQGGTYEVMNNEPAVAQDDNAAVPAAAPIIVDTNIPGNIPKTKAGLPDLRNAKAREWVADIAVKIHRFSLDRLPPTWLPKKKDNSIDMTKKVAQLYVEAQSKAGGRRVILPTDQQKLNKRSKYYMEKMKNNKKFLAAVARVRKSVVKPEVFLLLNNEEILQTAERLQAGGDENDSTDEETFETPSYIPEAHDHTLLVTCPQTDEHRIGRGAFGAVYKGHYNGEDVAVKVLHLDRMSENDKEDFHKEVAILASFGNHQNLVKFYAYTNKMYYSIVMEYVELGSLQHLLYFASSDELEAKITDGRYKKRIIDGIASGMRQLHSVDIIHNDLKPANVLVTRDFTAKVSDFGLANLRGRTTALIRTDRIAGEDNVIAGTSAYMAPERLDAARMFNDGVRKAGDVYSFAITFNEILHEEEPFAEDYANFAAMGTFGAARYAKNGKRPFLNASKIPTNVRRIVERCWHSLPEARPSFEAIVNHLKSPEVIIPNFIDIPQQLVSEA